MPEDGWTWGIVRENFRFRSPGRKTWLSMLAQSKADRLGAWTWLSRLMPRRFQATEKTAMAISTELAEALARCAAPATVTGPDRFLGILTALVRSIILPVRVALNNRFAGEVSGKNDCTRRPLFGETDSWTLLRAPRKEGNPTRRYWLKGSGNSLKTLILASTKSRRALEHQVEL
jgi:hypothetical protein